MKKYLVGTAALLAIFGVYLGWSEFTYQNVVSAPYDESKKSVIKEVEILSGSTPSIIAGILKEEEVIGDSDVFLKYVKREGVASKLQASTYYLNSGMTIPEITEILLGLVETDRIKITIPEGYSISEIASLLERKKISTRASFLDCVEVSCPLHEDFPFLPDRENIEGYFFPDTYYINRVGYSDEKFATQMLQNFETKVVEGLKAELAESTYTLDQNIIMASIIEKESRPRDNQAMVAGVLWKRLENDVQLAADATTRYAKQNPLDDITMADLLSDNPYNSRRIKGLPPSGISNPGLLSIKATLSPESSPYWYYLHDNTGQIHYSKTENEHNSKKRQYLQ